jgi:hypothetical protein
MMKEICNSCLDNSDFEYFPYDDHLSLGKEIENHIPMDINLFSSSNNIKRCKRCGYSIYDCEISDDKLQKYYQSSYKNWNQKSIEIEGNNTFPFLSDMRSIGQYTFIKDYIGNSGNQKLLEIGAGVAYPMRYIQYMKGCIPEMFVIEPGESFSAYYNQIGIHKISDHFPDSNLLANSFDYIHGSQWLEHVINIDDNLLALKRILTDNGLLFLEVPNCNETYFQLDIKDTPHVHFFTSDSIKYFAKRYEFELLAMGTYWLTFQDYYKRANNQLDNGIEEKASYNSMNNIQTTDGAWLRVLLKNHK